MSILLPLLLSLSVQAAPSDTRVPSLAEQTRLTSQRYAAVVDELEAADTAHLSDVQRAARRQLLDALRAYRERADFGRNDELHGARLPVFVDSQGRRCAMAELLHVSGELALVERVRSTSNHAWILDLAGDAQFEGWLDEHGLGFEEAARIQGPTIDPGPSGPSDVPGGMEGRRSGGGSYGGPGDTAGGSTGPAGAGPATGAPGSSGPGGPRTGPVTGGGPSTGGGNGPSQGPRPTTANMATTTDDGWWLWWEYAKLEFITPNRLSLANTPITGSDAAGSLREAIERARQANLPLFTAAAGSPEATTRGAAAVALGQTAGRAGVEPLLALLADPNQEVRHRAILGLGATGSPPAALALLNIARTGAHSKGGAVISPYARSIAIVALALSKRAGLHEPVDTAVAAIVRERADTERDGVALAAMFHHVLSPTETLEKLALELAVDETVSPGVRCRATEALASTQDQKTLSKLQHVLSGPRMDLRRSAAIALGATRNAIVLPALQTAHELEAEGLTRGFILIAIGRIGGSKAHSFLAQVLVDGESGQRRWAALALGILARGTNDPEICKLLRAAWDREKNADARAAYWLACGLLKDEHSVPGLVRELSGAADPRQRMYAATALSLVGGPRAATALRERLPLEKNSMARVGITQALGIVGETQDVAGMRSSIERLAEPGLQSLGATSLAFHGTPEALAQLGELSVSNEGPRVRRAASIEGLGLMLARSKPLAMSNLSRQMNYTVMPDWAASLFQTML